MGRLQSLRQGGAQFARAELEKAVMANPSDPDAYLYFAEADLQEHRIADAEGLLLEVKPLIDKFNANAKRKRGFEIRFNSFMAAVAEAREQWDTAAQYLAALQKLEPENPTSVEAHLRMGRAMFKQGKSKTDVYFELEKASKTDSKAIDPYIYLAYLNEEDKRHPEAKEIIAQAVTKHGSDLNVMLAAAKWALNTGEFKDAQNVCRCREQDRSEIARRQNRPWRSRPVCFSARFEESPRDVRIGGVSNRRRTSRPRTSWPWC